MSKLTRNYTTIAVEKQSMDKMKRFSKEQLDYNNEQIQKMLTDQVKTTQGVIAIIHSKDISSCQSCSHKGYPFSQQMMDRQRSKEDPERNVYFIVRNDDVRTDTMLDLEQMDRLQAHLRLHQTCSIQSKENTEKRKKNKGSSRKSKKNFGCFGDVLEKPTVIGFIARIDERVNMFTLNGWISKVHSPFSLASAGFHYRGEGTIIRCHYCNLKTDTKSWLENEKPREAHKRLKPDCKYLPEVNNEPFDRFQDGVVNGKKHNNVSSQNPQIGLDWSTTAVPTVLNISQAFAPEQIPLPIAQKNVNVEVQRCLTREEGQNHLDEIADRIENDGRDAAISSVSTSSLNSAKEVRYQEFRLERKRVQSYQNWTYHIKQQPTSLAKAGFFYTGENDIVRCFCCDLGLAEWDPKDDPWIEHGRHSPDCWFLIAEKGSLFVESVQINWKKIYNPKHSAFDDKDSRIATFGGWRIDIEQTKEILAEAGFFYTGDEDTVRCHYCDGGLRNWEPGDDPWEEHTRWFPFCKYVIKMKGREYIEEIRRQTQAREMTQNNNHSNRSLQDLLRDPVVQELKNLDISDENIKYGVMEYARNNGNTKMSLQVLMNIIFSKEERNGKTESPFSVFNVKEDKAEIEKDPKKLLATNRILKDQFICMRCKTKESCILFVNCGHRVTCQACSENIAYCPKCDVKIKKRMKTYIA